MAFMRVAVSAIVVLMCLNLRPVANAAPVMMPAAQEEDPCEALRETVERLARDVDFLERDLAAAERRRTNLLNSVINHVEALEATQRELETLPERARQQIIVALGEEVIETLGIAAFFTMSIMVGGELLPLALHQFVTVLEVAHLASTASELADIASEADEAGAALSEAESMMGLDHRELRQFAREHEFTELVRLIDTVEAIPNIKRNLSAAWDRWLSNEFSIVTLQMLLDQKRVELQEAADALDLCEEERQTNEDPCHIPPDCAVCWFCP
jgi:hypothetical protein